MAAVLPAGPGGVLLDLDPGAPLPPDVTPPDRPDLYAVASWVSATYCRCWPELCIRRPGPADDPDPISSDERGRPPGVNP